MLEQVASKLADIKKLSLKELNALGERLKASDVGSKVNELSAKASEVGEKAGAEIERMATEAFDRVLSVHPDPASVTPALKHELVSLLKEPMHDPASVIAGAKALGEALSDAMSEAVRHAPKSLSESFQDLKAIPQTLVVRLVDEAKNRLAHKTDSSKADGSFKSGEFHDAAGAAESPAVEPALGVEAAARQQFDATHESGKRDGEHKAHKKSHARQHKESAPSAEAAAAGAGVPSSEENH